MKKIKKFMYFLKYKDDLIINAFVQMFVSISFIFLLVLLTAVVANVDWAASIVEKVFNIGVVLLGVAVFLLLIFGPVKIFIYFIEWKKANK
ncbi:hypothetical protein IW492_02795 [Enterococcus sp. BWB1-3]|uniref:hypothetical protein n=1 Tax=Enterococcus sp. BWB1-3 TaxID=2787713 RepID=UPI001921C94F|nr:hypothetical protein [Enterococcus sp. BWB1-3]MBL1228159.1 hypothetical protein [Enterococcus sp. BWB1-3]